MIYLIGTGQMAIDYAKVLKELRTPLIVIGRGASSANKFYESTQIKPEVGGLQQFLKDKVIEPNSKVIVATGTESLMTCLLMLIKQENITDILIEKPAAISITELLENEEALLDSNKNIFIGYNRRFYLSIQKALELIQEDGGLLSMHFEFTEWAHKIEPLIKADKVKENWFFANSTHVVDAAFYIAGNPTEMDCYISGNLSWHQPSIFSGAGITKNNVIFSYKSNWESAGRWSIELFTKERKIILCPLETINIQKRGSIEINELPFENQIETNFKPGLLKQVSSFIENQENLLKIKEHILNTKEIYSKILKGKN